MPQTNKQMQSRQVQVQENSDTRKDNKELKHIYEHKIF